MYKIRKTYFFDRIIVNKNNLGIIGVIKSIQIIIFSIIIFIKDDFIIDFNKFFINNCCFFVQPNENVYLRKNLWAIRI